jgi:Ca2+-transporting ATPase
MTVTSPRDGRPYATARVRADERSREIALGAPEAILEFGPLSASARQAWDALIATEAARGGRLLLLATRSGEEPWELAALLRFGDPVRADVPEAVALAARAGIQVMMVTGDHPTTAGAVADAVGLPAGRPTTGGYLDASTDEAVTAELSGVRVVARAVPDHKLRLVRLAQAAGRSVAVTGDGVNDAPALQAADVAVAMGSGSAVAREASDLVLGDDSFTTMMRGLREGRRIVANVQKGLVFLVSTHVALLGFILVATIAGFSQPLLPLQILWLELFIDLSTSIAFEREPEEPGTMDQPPRPRGRPLLTTGILARIAAAGGFSAVAAFGVLLAHPGSFEHARWTAYTALVAAQVVRAYANRSLDHPVHRLAPNGFLALACLVAVAIQILMPFVPFLADAFSTVPLTAADWGVVAAIALAPALVAEVVRRTGRAGEWVA